MQSARAVCMPMRSLCVLPLTRRGPHRLRGLYRRGLFERPVVCSAGDGAWAVAEGQRGAAEAVW